MTRSIRSQLLLFTLILILVAVNLTAGIALYLQFSSLEESHIDFAEDLIDVYQRNLQEPLYAIETHRLTAQLQSLRTNQDIANVFVLDQEGVVLADGTDENLLQEEPYPPLAPILRQLSTAQDPFHVWNHNNNIAITYRINTTFGEFLGYLHLELGRDDIKEATHDMLWEFLLIESIVLIFAVIAALMLSSYFHRPLRQAVTTANAIASGNFQSTLKTPRQDEFGMLNDALDQMSLNIQQNLSELHETQQELEEIFRSMVDGVIVVSSDGTILKTNRKMETLAQFEAQSLSGKPLNTILPDLNPSDELGSISQQNRLINSAGESMTVQINGAQLDSRQRSSQASAVLMIHDLSDYLRAERQEQYAAFQAGIAEMGASVLHNIGNVITGMVGNLMRSRQILKVTEKLPEKLMAYAEKSSAIANNRNDAGVDELAERLLESSQVLEKTANAMTKIRSMSETSGTFEKLDHGIQHISDIISIQQSASRPVIHSTEFHLQSMVDDTLSLIEDRISKYKISQEITLAPEVDLVRLPRNPLIQLMLNLLKNSLEAITEEMSINRSDDGFIRLTTAAAENDFFTITVEDSGCGTDNSTLEQIFKTGFTTKSEGSGYGLHSAANFVHQLGGEITAKSDGLHQGMKITVLLPISTEENKKAF